MRGDTQQQLSVRQFEPRPQRATTRIEGGQAGVAERIRGAARERNAPPIGRQPGVHVSRHGQRKRQNARPIASWRSQDSEALLEAQRPISKPLADSGLFVCDAVGGGDGFNGANDTERVPVTDCAKSQIEPCLSRADARAGGREIGGEALCRIGRLERSSARNDAIGTLGGAQARRKHGLQRHRQPSWRAAKNEMGSLDGERGGWLGAQGSDQKRSHDERE
jgi:hypothetical protein